MTGSLRGAASLLALALLLLAGCGRGERLNVLLVTFDTTRADALGPYGHAAGHTPNLDRLAASGTLFERSFSAVPITAPSHSTILTGTYPPYHGVRDNGLFVLPQRARTLAEVLSEAGYKTGAAVGAFPLLSRFGLDQGFDFYDDLVEDPIEPLLGLAKPDLFFDERSAAEVNRALRSWLDGVVDKPFFSWLHYWEPHHPHLPPQPYAQLYEYDPYLGEIATADEALGQILDYLEERGVLDRTVVVMTADHGEGRGEHREETHSLLAYNATLHVPLIIRVPGRGEGLRVSERVGTVDLVPTVLDILGLEAPPEVQGRSLAFVFDHPEAEREASSDVAYYAETLSPRVAHGWSELRTLYFGDHKYIFGARPELYDQAADFAELDDLSASEPERALKLDRDLRRFVGSLSAPEVAAQAAVEADDETLRRLAALGYIATGGQALGGEVVSADGPAPQDRVEEITRVSRIKSLLVEGEAWSARREALKLVEADGGNSYYRELLARALLELELPAEALEAVRPSGPTSDGARFVYLRAAQHQLQMGDPSAAEATIRQVLAVEDDPRARIELASLLGATGDPGGAEVELERALAIEPDLARARLELGVLLSRRGDLVVARRHLEQAAMQLPLYPVAHFRLGALLLKTSDPERALIRFNRARELAPEACYPHAGRAEAFRALGREDEAREAMAELMLGCDDSMPAGALAP